MYKIHPKVEKEPICQIVITKGTFLKWWFQVFVCPKGLGQLKRLWFALKGSIRVVFRMKGGGRFVSVLKHSIASLVLNVHYFTPLKSWTQRAKLRKMCFKGLPSRRSERQQLGISVPTNRSNLCPVRFVLWKIHKWDVQIA